MFEENNQINDQSLHENQLSSYLETQQINLNDNLLYMHWGTNQINHYCINSKQHKITTADINFN